LSFQRFLGFPETLPDCSTVWMLRERLADTGKDRLIWAELQRQLDEKGLSVNKGGVENWAVMSLVEWFPDRWLMDEAGLLRGHGPFYE